MRRRPCLTRSEQSVKSKEWNLTCCSQRYFHAFYRPLENHQTCDSSKILAPSRRNRLPQTLVNNPTAIGNNLPASPQVIDFQNVPRQRRFEVSVCVKYLPRVPAQFPHGQLQPLTTIRPGFQCFGNLAVRKAHTIFHKLFTSGPGTMRGDPTCFATLGLTVAKGFACFTHTQSPPTCHPTHT